VETVVRYFLLIPILFCVQALGSPLLLTIRGAEDVVANYCAGTGCLPEKILRAQAQEFENGNTFLKLKENVSAQDIKILIPSQLTANQLFELLILIRTLKGEFVTSIDVASSMRSISVVDSKGATLLNGDLVYQFLRVAGMDTHNGKYFHTQLPAKAAYKKTNESIIAAQPGLRLAQELSTLLEVPVFDRSQQLPLPGRSIRVLQVASNGENYNEELLKSLVETYSLKNRKFQVTFLSPYLPYARSDKKDQSGVAITGRLVADLIETAGADSIVFVRAHAPQSEGFFSIPTLQVSGRKTINQFLKAQNVEVVVSPDAGFQKDATLYADELRIPISVVNKQRNLETGESVLKGISGESVAGKKVVIIDDETASGSTLAKAAELLKSLGAKSVICVVTHLAGTAEKALKSPFIDLVVVTNSLPVKVTSEKLKVLSLAEEISNQVRKIVKTNQSARARSCRASVSGL
jgi:ribose-phosphate pyrophosphokinase